MVTVRPLSLVASVALAALVALSAAGFSCGGEAPPAPLPTPLLAGPVIVTPPVATKPAYPPARKEDVVDTYAGGGAPLVVHDPYRWLESWDAPEVKQWSEAENAFARKLLDGVPSRGPLGTRIEQLLGERSPSWFALQKRGATWFALERRPPKQHPFLVVRSSVDTTDERVLLDAADLDASGGTNLEWFVPSFDGRKVAVSLSKGGGEHGDVHVFDVGSGKELGDVVPQADGSGGGDCLAWKKDGSGFFYTRGAAEADKPKDGPGIYEQVWFHSLGKPVSDDAMVVGKGGPAIAQWELVASGDGAFIVARMEYGDGGEYDQWLLGPSGGWKEIAPRSEGVKRMVVGPRHALYLLSTKDAPHGMILETSLTAPSLSKADIAIAGGKAITDFVPGKTRLYLVEREGGPSQISYVGYSLHRGPPRAATATPVESPPESAITEIIALGDDDIAFSAVSYTQPSAWYRTEGGAATKTKLASTSAADFSQVEVKEEHCTSKDGTKVPLTILSPRSSLAPAAPGHDGGASPTLLTAYGGFGISVAPRFRPELLAWLEQGGVYAVANIRGGGELGEDWHRGGNLTHKQNVFDDFYACARRLAELKVTTAEHLAIRGGSNGGLLMGAELTQHPEAWKAVVSQVGIYDMLRVERDANGVFNTTEYGSVKDPAQRDALAAYSPYQHVQAGVAYPATLFMTGANDPRVNPYHSRKMVARLQDATSSSAPILLRTSAGTGHGMGSPLHAIIEETIDIDAFLFHELGVPYRPR